MSQRMVYGYACINNTLASEGIQVNRSMMKKTFLAKGLPGASALALANVQDLVKLLHWNIAHDIRLYRMSSDMFPWMSEYELVDLPDFSGIAAVLKEAGQLAAANGLRLTFHPGPFNVLASANEHVVTKTLKELRQHGEIMDLLGLPRTPFSKINIHVGGAYGDKRGALNRFLSAVDRLDEAARLRLTIENDDKPNMFSVNDLLMVAENANIPIVFDYLHHQFCMGDLTEQEALELAMKTWPAGVRPIVHYSSPKKIFEDPSAADAAHADFIYQTPRTYGYDIDIMFEAKAKEQAIFAYADTVKTLKTKKADITS